MTDFVGAWSLGDEPVARALDAGTKALLLEQLAAYPDGVKEHASRRLWVVAAGGKMTARNDRLLAYEGFLATGTRRLDEWLGEASSSVSIEGHYVLAHADGRTLTLQRSLSGGERLYFTRVGDVIFFAASLRPLLAHPDIGRTLDRDVFDEALINGHLIFGDRTLAEGIREVLPGHALTLDEQVGRQQLHTPEALRSPPGDPHRSARRFHEALCESIELAVGRRRPVALALSGGIDSSAVAAALVDVVGADDVHAFTYEFDDEAHDAPETHYARLVTRRLGIRKHEVFPIRFDDFVPAVLEHVWRSESSVHWPKGFLLPVARHLRSRGYDRYLTGFGIGSHMAYLGELARILPWLPRSAFRLWKKARFGGWVWLEHLARLHPGLEPPHNRLYDLLLHVLEDSGHVRDRKALYPAELGPLLRARGSFAELEPDLARRPLRERLRMAAFSHLVSCVDVTRSEKASREVGVCRVSPAHFARTLPYAYFPPQPAPFVWSANRRLRPGKYLARLAYAGVLPDEVLYRKKSWADAVASNRWRRKGRVMMLRALPGFPDDTAAVLGDRYPRALDFWEPQSILANSLSLWLWRELFIVRAPARIAPTWRDLIDAPVPSAHESEPPRAATGS